MLKNIKNKPYREKKRIFIAGIVGFSLLMIPLWAFSFTARIQKKTQADSKQNTDLRDLRQELALSLEALQDTLNEFREESVALSDATTTQASSPSTNPIKTLPQSEPRTDL